MEKHVAICIPRVDKSITNHFIFKTFCNLKIGYIESIYDMPIYNKNDRNASSQYNRIIVKIKWNDEPNAKYMLSRFQEGKSVKVVYGMPWYWICLPNRPYVNHNYNNI